MAVMQLSLFGGFQAVCDGKPLVFHSNKVRALLGYLAVEAGRPHPREALAALLWSEYEERTALTNLRNTLSKLNQTLAAVSGRQHTGNDSLLSITRTTVRFDYPTRLDVAEFDSLIAACEHHSHPMIERCYLCLARLTRAVDLHRDDFMAGIAVQNAPAFEEWRLAQRERRHMQTLSALRTIVEHYATLGTYAEMERYARRIIELEPWREEAHLLVMKALAYRGDRQGSLTQYEAGRTALQNELGQPPSSETTAFYNKVKSGVLPSIPSARLHHFPQPTSRFVGNQTELAQIVENLLDPDCRLLTVLGPGGSGKTRISLEVARRVAHWAEFKDGLYFVSLAGDSDGHTLLHALTLSLKLPLRQKGLSVSQIVAFLKDKHVLIVIDGFEQSHAKADDDSQAHSDVTLIKTILDAVPGLKCITTSMVPLYLRAEWRQNLAGLSCPPPDVDTALLRNLSHFPAMELFVRMAERVRGTPLPTSDYKAVARICRLTHGIPLAMEIAAAWADRYTCDQLASEIEANLDFLTSPMLDMPQRHRSMRAVFDAAWKFLSLDEQRVLAQLSIFKGGFTTEAVLAVVGGVNNPVALISILTDKCMIQPANGGRFECHALLCQFATEKLQAMAANHDWARATAMRHSTFYLGLVSKHTNLYPALADLGADLENIRAASQWASAQLNPLGIGDAAQAGQNLVRAYLQQADN
jgi:DNA-binding SARP family transcriptional activator/predicted ATPase